MVDAVHHIGEDVLARYLAVAVIGVSLGLSIGALTDGAAHRYGWAALLVGMALLLFRPGTGSTSLIAPVDGSTTGRDRADNQPTLQGLGTRVEQILRLAEEQAEDHRAEARQEAEEILRAARVEADEILAGARDAAPDSARDDRQGGQSAQ